MSNSIPTAFDTQAGSSASTDSPSTPLTDAVSGERLGREVLATLLPAYAAFPQEQLLQISLDIQGAVSCVLGVLPEVKALRAAVVEASPSYDIALFDQLEMLTIGLNEAHARYVAATKPSAELEQVVEEALERRTTLLADATSLGQRGLVNITRLNQIKGPIGYKNIAADLNLLVQVLEPSLAAISGKSAISRDELDRVARLQQRLLRLVGEKEQSAPATAQASDLRQRAYTAFVKAYDHVRRAVHFLRWKEGDADSITPSLFAGRGPRRRNSESSNEVPSAQSDVPVTPAAAAAAANTAQSSGGGVLPAGNAPAHGSDPFLT